MGTASCTDPLSCVRTLGFEHFRGLKLNRNRGPVTGRSGPIWSAGRPAATRAAQPPNGAAL